MKRAPEGESMPSSKASSYKNGRGLSSSNSVHSLGEAKVLAMSGSKQIQNIQSKPSKSENYVKTTVDRIPLTHDSSSSLASHRSIRTGGFMRKEHQV